MKITDCNKNLNSKQQFQIEVDDVWHTVQAADFFDYLYNAGRIDGHDPESETAWTSGFDVRWNAARQEPEEIHTGESHSYEWWLGEFVDDDQVLLEYMKTSLIAESVLIAA